MKRAFLMFATTLLLATAFTSAGQAEPSAREISIPGPGLLQEYRIPIADLLEEGEDLTQFQIVQQPTFGTLVIDGDSLLFQPTVDFETAGGDVFVYEVAAPRISNSVRLAFLSNEPRIDGTDFTHGFEGNFDGWDEHPDLEDPKPPRVSNGDPEPIFSFISDGIVGRSSLEAKLSRTDHLRREEDGFIPLVGSNGAWGGGTTVIVCPDDDPDSQGDELPDATGEVVPYRAVGPEGEARLRLRRLIKGEWEARVELEGVVCVAGQACMTPWLKVQQGVPEHVNIGVWRPGERAPEEPSELRFHIGPDSSDFVQIPFQGTWEYFDDHDLGVMELQGLSGFRLVFDDLRIFGYFDPFEQRIADGFETGDFSTEWDDRSSAVGLSVETTAALTGSWGLSADPDNPAGGPEKVLKETVDEPAEDYGARFQIDTTGLMLAPGESIKILGGSYALSPVPDHLKLTLVGTGAGVELVGELVDDNGVKRPTRRVSLPSGSPHTIVLRWVSGDPGSFWIWRNGVLADVVQLNNPLARIKDAQMGMFDLVLDPEFGAQLGAINIDDFVAWSGKYSLP